MNESDFRSFIRSAPLVEFFKIGQYVHETIQRFHIVCRTVQDERKKFVRFLWNKGATFVSAGIFVASIVDNLMLRHRRMRAAKLSF
jgi:hypothetical protein